MAAPSCCPARSPSRSMTLTDGGPGSLTWAAGRCVWSGSAQTPPRSGIGWPPAGPGAMRPSWPTSRGSPPACGSTPRPRPRTSQSTTASPRPPPSKIRSPPCWQAASVTSAEEGDERGLERSRQAPLEPWRGEQPGVGGVAHVAAFDQDLRLGGQVETGEVVPGDEAVLAVIVAHRHGGVLQQRRANIVAQVLGGRDDAVVGPVRDRLQDGEPAPPGRAAIGVDVQRNGGAGAVEYVGPAGDARPDAGVAVPRHHHPRAGPPEVGPQVTGYVPVESGLGVPAVGLGAGRIAGLVLPAVPDDAVDKCRIGGIAAVMAGVDPNGLAGQWGGG